MLKISNKWVLRPKSDICMVSSELWGTLQKWEQKECESSKQREGWWYVIFWERHDWSNQKLIAGIEDFTEPEQEWACQQAEGMWKCSGDPFASCWTICYWYIQGLTWDVIAFSFVLTGDPIGLYWTVPNQWSHIWPWLNQFGHETNPKVVNLGKRLINSRRGSW